MTETLWDWGFAWQVMPQILQAAVITIEATLLGFVLAATLGLLLALGRRSRRPLLQRPVAGFVEFVRSTPLLVQLYFLYYVLPQEFGITLPAMVIGVVGLGLHFSTYCSEVYRSGLDSVPKGQWEAAIALNLSRWRTYRDVVIPQAIPPIVPALGNYLIAMFKETPLLSAIAVVEMMNRAKIIGSQTFRYVEPITIVGVIFLVLSLISMVGVRHFEGWLRYKVTRQSR
jgi:polar amino acid transport system permease protein